MGVTAIFLVSRLMQAYRIDNLWCRYHALRGHRTDITVNRPTSNMLAEIISWTVLTSLLLLVSNCQSDPNFQCPEPGSDSAGLDRVDCFPEGDPTEATCEKRACCWDKVNRQSKSPLPRCFIPKGYGYFAESDPEYASGVWTAVIKRAGSLSWFGGDVDLLAVRVEEHTDRRLRIKVI